MPIAVTLLPWEPRVSAGRTRLDLLVEGERAVVCENADAGVASRRGWFAVYEKTVFGVFEWLGSETCNTALFLDGKIWFLTNTVELTSMITLTHRSFRVADGTTTFVFKYHRLWWNLLHRPKTALFDVVFADDWWGVVCDLPGWVEGQWNAGKLSGELPRSLSRTGD